MACSTAIVAAVTADLGVKDDSGEQAAAAASCFAAAGDGVKLVRRDVTVEAATLQTAARRRLASSSASFLSKQAWQSLSSVERS